MFVSNVYGNHALQYDMFSGSNIPYVKFSESKYTLFMTSLLRDRDLIHKFTERHESFRCDEMAPYGAWVIMVATRRPLRALAARGHTRSRHHVASSHRCFVI